MTKYNNKILFLLIFNILHFDATQCLASTSHATQKEENSLDPKDWKEFEALAHRMVSDMVKYLSTIRDRPVWRPVPESVKKNLKEPLPLKPTKADEVYEKFKENILPYPTGNIHPRFWGWVMGTGTPDAVLADMLASTINSHVSGYDQAPPLVEDQVISWFVEAMKFPKESTGLLVSGATMANIIGITVARNTKAPFNIRKEGLQGAKQKLVLYCSSETHSWAQKACELLGLGSNALRRIPVNEKFQIDLKLLQEKIREDKENGAYPFCVIGTAGTVNTGSIDDLKELSEICKRENLWLHIDGAFGSLVGFSEKYSYLVEGQNLADSLAFDLHKWMYMPFEAGCILIRHPEIQADTFTVTPSYLSVIPRGIASKPMKYSNLGLELTRGFKALKVWMSLKIHGFEEFSKQIEKNIEQAHYLVSLIEHQPKIQLLAPSPLNIVCFRYFSSSLGENELNEFNKELLLRIQEKGIAIPSSTLIKGKFALRVAITNHRSRQDDFDQFLKSVLDISKELEEEYIGNHKQVNNKTAM